MTRDGAGGVPREAFDALFARPPYGARAAEKDPLLLAGLNALTRWHYDNCPAYRRILDGLWRGRTESATLAEVPYLPVSLFKTRRLASVPEDAVRVTLTSSGTTGQAVSQILVDAETSARQQKALAGSLGHVLGPRRLPMLVIDTSAVFKDPRTMSARGAGVLGIMRYGRNHAFALDAGMRPDTKTVEAFLEKFAGRPFFMFGFTFMVWLEFFEKFKDKRLDLSRGVLIHSGGWKKMIDRAVGPEIFRRRMKERFGLSRIHNFYGMVEQIGSIFLEGPGGLLYPPNFSDVIVRDPESWAPVPEGETGVIQVLSLLPGSYPGHSLLTEDLGAVEDIDPGEDGWMGKGLKVHGRVARAELRGCSDAIGMQAS